jgi:hypothetical protein
MHEFDVAQLAKRVGIKCTAQQQETSTLLLGMGRPLGRVPLRTF